MSESTDLIRRLESAIATKSLHPEYARGLLREAKEALSPADDPPEQIVLNAWCAAQFGAVPSTPNGHDEA